MSLEGGKGFSQLKHHIFYIGAVNQELGFTYSLLRKRVAKCAALQGGWGP